MERSCIVTVWSASAFLQLAAFRTSLHLRFSFPHPPRHESPLASQCLPAVSQTGTHRRSLQPICPNPAHSGGALTSPFSQLSYRLLRTSALSLWIRGTRECPGVGCSYGPLKGITHFDAQASTLAWQDAALWLWYWSNDISGSIWKDRGVCVCVCALALSCETYSMFRRCSRAVRQ